ncbi:MAG: HlyD family type I secretion periplasmic adaptor subunit [Pseudorhodobacter sp.]|nr:MAG: HlyD family type I secretion periplasmic adaptor subunit [Pseudorhodobacter sp.]
MTTQSYLPRFNSARLPMLIGIGAIAALVFGFGTWAAVTEIDGAVVSTGKVIVDRNRQAVQHPDGGVVRLVRVREGQKVAAGQVLMELDPTLAESQLRSVEGQLAEIKARRGRLEAERDNLQTIRFDPELLQQGSTDPAVARYVDGQSRLFDMRREGLQQEVAQLEIQKVQLQNQIDGIDAQIAALDRQAALVAEEMTVQKELQEKGLAQSTKVRSLEREQARLAGMSGEMGAARAEAMEQIAELNIKILRLTMQRQQEALTTLRDLEMTELQLTEEQQALRTQLDRMEVKAPVAGVVYDLRILGPQSVIRPADPMMFIVPQDRPLVIEARVRPINVNSVHVSQEVVVRFPAFDMRQTPDLMGHVVLVSPDAFVDSNTGESYYRAEVELAEAELRKLKPDQVIIPGMPADAFIRTGEHTPLAYLLAPLTRYFGTALRDKG